MQYDTRKLNDFINESLNGEILLPNFQRVYIWERLNQQKALLASIIYNIPIGSVLLLKGKTNDFSTKKLGVKEEIFFETNESVKYLLDGQQRLSTLKSFL